MSKITNPGLALAAKLKPAYDETAAEWPGIVEICSLIARHARTHKRLSVESLNGPAERERVGDWQGRWSADLNARTAACEKRLAGLIAALPATSAGRIGALLGGDARGITVKLVMPGELSQLHDSFGRDGVLVDQD